MNYQNRNGNHPPHNHNGYPNHNTYNNYNGYPNHNTYNNYNAQPNHNTYNNYNGHPNHNRYPEHNHHSYHSSSSRSSKNSPASFIIMGIFFLIIGIIMTIASINERNHYNDIVDDGNSAVAQITDVDRRTSTRTRRSSNGRRRTTTETTYYIDAIYVVDGEQYSVNFSTKSSSYSQGEFITVFYEDGNPSNYVREGDDGDSIIFGIIFSTIGLVFFITGIKKHRDEKDLKAMGLL